MIIVDAALEKAESEGKPIRVAIFGAGYMGRGIALQLLDRKPGLRLVGFASRRAPSAQNALLEMGATDYETVSTISDFERVASRGGIAVTDDPAILCRSGNVDVVIDATSDLEAGARFVLDAIQHGKHTILLNAVLDATIGPILKTYADRNNVIITYIDGDEPGVAVNLFRFVKTIGYRPVAAGNLKGFLNHYRTPETQRAFAERVKQTPEMITSFADGTKLSMECTILANATGLKIGKRGMYGPPCTNVKEASGLFPMDQLLNGGLTDYLLGAEPGTGVFVIGYNDHPIKSQYMNFFKMGDGPLYTFYTPFHLPQVQMLTTIARAALFHDATATPLGKPVSDVLTLAKRDLKAGEILDGIGGYTCYGENDNADVAQEGNFLPMGLSEGCRLKRDIPKDQVITYTDVIVPEGRLGDKLRAEQNQHFSTAHVAA